jgi:outer membrane protein OmpA-like peptidoglycan-associated protein
MSSLASSSPRRSLVTALVCAALLSARAGAAMAQDRFSLESFDPAPDREGGLVAVHGARPLVAGELGLSVMGSYGRAPLTLKSASSGDSLGQLVGSVGTLQLLGTVGIARRFDVGLAVPLHRMSAGSDFAVDPGPAVTNALLTSGEVGFGDVRVVPRFGLMVREVDEGVGLALLVPVWLPTGDDDLYAGEDVRVEPRLALDVVHRGLTAALNVGYMVRSEARLLNSTVDDQLRVALGVAIPLGQSPLKGLLELDSQLNVLGGDFGSEDASTEGRVGLRLSSRSGVQLDVGGGPGIVRGVGAPSYRLYAAIGYVRHEEPRRDADGDGLLDETDRCPSLPEDPDGFADADGCPDADNDGDGVRDGNDRCPADAEDADGFQDDDGCPDLDNDEDGVRDASDRCATEPEDTDGFQDEDGCPDLDNDGDGVLDAADACVDQPGSAEHRGCPAPAAPEAPPALAVVTEDRIEIKDKIFFAVNKAVIEERSAPLLDAIAEVLKAHPEIEVLRVEGHTDDTGRRFRNQQLSEQRAEAVVDALVKRGIALERLVAKGFGPSQPLVPNDSDDHRAQNRRTELHIARRAEPAAPAPAAAPTPVPAP